VGGELNSSEDEGANLLDVEGGRPFVVFPEDADLVFDVLDVERVTEFFVPVVSAASGVAPSEAHSDKASCDNELTMIQLPNLVVQVLHFCSCGSRCVNHNHLR